MSRRKKIINQVEVIDIAHKGHSIGKTPEGEVVVLLENVPPGEVVSMVVTRKKKGLKHGFVQDTLKSSPHRVPPVCNHFGVCGGCKWQHFDYQKQLIHKENAVRQAIIRIAKDEGNKVKPIIGADPIYAYRNKLEYSGSTKRWLTKEEIDSETQFDDRAGLGFHISGAFDKVLDIEQCHLQDDLSNELRNTLRSLAIEHQWSYFNIREQHGLLRNLMVRNSTLGQWMITFIFGENDSKTIQVVMQEMINRFPSVNSWNYIVNTKGNSSFFDLPVHHFNGKPYIEEVLGNIRYRISPKSFFQTNSYQAKILYDLALSLAALDPDDIVYDLYTGTGSIALYLAHNCLKVVGIEVIDEAIRDAKINAQINGIENASFLVGDVKDVLEPQFKDIHGYPDVVITDPPRAGMHADVVATLLALLPKKIVYISCNPATQARDIELLKKQYHLEEVIPVDMFPHTSHIESVALLTLAT